MAAEKHSIIQKWGENFEKDAFVSLDKLSFRTEFMGELERNDTDEILFRIFHNKNEKVKHQLDEGMREWFANYWGKIPGSLPTVRWARILKNAFIVVNRLNLEQTYFFLRDIYYTDKSWLRSITIDPSRDPEGELLRTLALNQKNRLLLSLWMGLCKMEEDLPIDYAAIGLLGVRKLPEENGNPPKDLPGAFFKREMRAVAAHYPRSRQYWANYFYPFLHGRDKDMLAEWLNKVSPKLFTDFNINAGTNVYIKPPGYERRTHFLNLIISNEPLEKFRSDLEIFLSEHPLCFANRGFILFSQNIFRYRV